MKRTLLFALVCLLITGCSKSNSSKYEIIGTWKAVSCSSGNDISGEFTEEFTYNYLWVFEQNGTLKQSDDESGVVHTTSTTWSLSGDVITIEDDGYKILEYDSKMMVIRYDGEYSEYQGQQVHSWLQYKLTQ